jgi:uncharacterized repeat protein (TIGR03803 family)
MKTRTEFGNRTWLQLKNLLAVPAGVLLLCLLAANGRAQTFTTLHSFTAPSGSQGYIGTNSDGAYPFLGLLLSGNTLYGTAQVGGSSGWGTVFALNPDGTSFTTLYNFTATSGSKGNYGSGTNSDGAAPCGGLILSGNTLYGTAQAGGTSGWGTVFAVNTDGTGFTNLHSFTATSGSAGSYGVNSDGASPYAGLILSGNTLYGTAQYGGASGWGTVFAVNIDGTGFTNLHNFTATSGSAGGDGINSDGANPVAGLTLSGNTLYGTALQGGSSGWGTVFAVNTNGTGFTNLHSFTAPSGSGGYHGINSDGAYPAWEPLILSGNTLYGTAQDGGSSGWGTVFGINTDGTGFTNLHSFTYNDGADPSAGLILSGNTLYGTAYRGGSSGAGTVFGLNTDGTGFTNLSFTYNDGANPNAGVILSGNTLYGMAFSGGSSGYGTVFAVNTNLFAVNTNVTLPGPQSTNGYWQLVWNDEFSGGSIAPNHWTFDIGAGGWGNNELEYYTSRSQNAYVSNGVLHIGARKENYNGSSYTSARLKTLGLFAQTYGRFEFRAKLPQGQGYWPALWMMPVDSVYGGWAASGEIDVMENNGSNPTTVLGTIHYGGTWPNQAQSSGPAYTFPAGDSVTNFHVYALEWTSNAVTWYVDSQLYETQTSWWSSGGSYPAPFDRPFYLIMNLAVGGNFVGPPNANTVFPGEMQVDYVRVYVWAPTPQLIITPSGANVVLTWPTNATGFTLQSTTNLGSSAVWSTNSPAPVVVSGQNTVTNPISGSQMFFRLSQ